MKKLFIILLVAIALLILPIRIFASGFYTDDFEDYDLGFLEGQGNWIEYGGYDGWIVVDDLFYYGSQSAWSSSTAGIELSIATTTPVIRGSLSAWVYLSDSDYSSSTEGYRPMVQILGQKEDKGALYGLGSVRIYYNATSSTFNFAILNGESDLIDIETNIALETWHLISIEFDLESYDYRASIDYGSYSGWADFYTIQEDILTIDGFGLFLKNHEVYCDSIGVDYFYEPDPYSDGSLVGSVKILYREYTGTPALFKWGFKVAGFNPDGYDELKFEISTSTLIATTTFDLTTGVYDTVPIIFERHHYLEDYPEDLYTLSFWFRDSTSGATTTVQNFYINLSVDDPQFTEQAYLEFMAGEPDAPIFEDIWGLGNLFKRNWDLVKLKFPVSWIYQIKDIWDEKIIELSTAESVEPISVVWTFPDTSVDAFDGKEIALFDLKGANDQYGSQIAVFRQILKYVIWLSVFYVIYGKTRGFLSSLSTTGI